MQVVTNYPDGIFCWVDLATNDPAGAKAFYSGLFGWTCVDVPTNMGAIYTMCQLDGQNVAGLGEMPSELQEQGIPSHWQAYIKYDDVDAAAARITAAGGTVLFPPFDVMQEGRMTMGQDTGGATFGLWQPNNHIGAQLVNRPNTLVWTELQTRDGDGALAFYSEAMGWSHTTDPNGYHTFVKDGRYHAGMIQMDETWPAEVPPNWTVYFMIEDVDTNVAKVEELGGTVLVPPTAAGDMGRFSVVQDPQGAVFNVMQFSGEVTPPPGS